MKYIIYAINKEISHSIITSIIYVKFKLNVNNI